MFEYIKTPTYDSINITSIVTVLDLDLRKFKSAAESHNFPEIIYIRDGYSDLPLDGECLHLDKGQLIIVAPNTIHGNPNKQPQTSTATHSIISFESNSPLLKELYNRVITLSETQIEYFLKLINIGLGIFEGVTTKNNVGGMKLKDNVPPHKIEHLKKSLEIFLIELYDANIDSLIDKHSNADFSKLTDFLNTNITQNFTVEEIAKGVGMSASTLRKTVQTHLGYGPLHYFLNLKINEAKRLIRLGNMNFTEISDHLGFETIHYFSRQFKNRTGKSPREYLKDITNLQ